MTRRTRRSSVAIRRGVLSLVLGVPLLSQPLQAQTSDVVGDPASVETSAEMRGGNYLLGIGVYIMSVCLIVFPCPRIYESTRVD